MTPFQLPKKYQKILYWLGKNSFKMIFKLFWRLEIVGAENIPSVGGVLIAANHTSYADPPLVGACAQRPLYFFAKEELFRIPVFGWLISQVNAFPVKRYEHDIGAFKRAQHLLQNGQVVLVFPEGRRSKTGELGKAKSGVGMLAYKTRVPVVPVYVANTRRLKEFKQLKILIGKPMFPTVLENEKEQYQLFSEGVLNAIANLKSKMYNNKLDENERKLA